MTRVEYVVDDRYGKSCVGGWVTVTAVDVPDDDVEDGE